MSWTDRYVSATASGGDGLSALTPWTLAEAIANAVAGMRMNVLAGTYANTTNTRTFSVAGTAIAPIWWRGYNTTIGDIDSNNALTKPVISFTTGQMVTSGTLQAFSNLDVQSACVTANGAWSNTGASVRIHRCRVANSAANSNARALTSSVRIVISSSYFSATATADRVVSNGGTASIMLACSLRGAIICAFSNVSALFRGCTIDSPVTAGISTNGAAGVFIDECSFYGGTSGVLHASAVNSLDVFNSIFSTQTNGINQSAGTNSSVVNALGCGFYAVTNPVVGVQECATNTDDLFNARGNLVLLADPFVSASSHDFTLTALSLARRAGIPGAFENESYTSRLDMGAVNKSGGLVPIGMAGGMRG